MTKTETKHNAVVEQTTALPITTSPMTMPKKDVVVGDMADQFGDMAGAGMENVQVGRDTLIPRLTILQSLSPQVKKNKPEYIEGAQVGDFCDVGLKQLMPKPLLFIPIYFMTQYLEWRPDRKGLAGIHGVEILEKCRTDEKNRHYLDNGNMIAETAQFFGLNVMADYRLTFIGMTSTQLKKARHWNTLAREQKANRKDGSTFTPPFFWRAYILSTVSESNDQGDWEGWKIEAGPRVDPVYGEMDPRAAQEVFNLGKEMLASIKAGRTKADLASMRDDDQSPTNSDRM